MKGGYADSIAAPATANTWFLFRAMPQGANTPLKAQGRIAILALTSRHRRAHNSSSAVLGFRPHPPQEAAMMTIVLVHLLSAAA
ncbi:MAG TPA: hypothetical protein VLW08_03350 [Casimicrobiaceae bacterium]|nr:hypothetical protein [Casimicrobiaceae bacterium]